MTNFTSDAQNLYKVFLEENISQLNIDQWNKLREIFNEDAISIKNFLDWKGINLRGANLSEADLRNAYLEGADLSDADLTYADLTSANCAT